MMGLQLTWCFTLSSSLPGTYVAFSVQSGTAKSWHSICAKYSQTVEFQMKFKLKTHIKNSILRIYFTIMLSLI